VTTLSDRIRALAATSEVDRVEAALDLAEDVAAALAADGLAEADAERLRTVLTAIVTSDLGAPRERLAVGELLGRVGDPRLRRPGDGDYWVTLTTASGESFQLGRYPVTNDEFRAFVADGGYERRELWSPEGLAWLDAADNPWPVLAGRAEIEAFVVANQPVVGVSYFEAEAYAHAHGARLPRWYERVWAVRGPAKRPYPWGSPFGEGNANTKEEVLGRPCAVGLYRRDVTPEGIWDLAGNAAEWTSESAGDEFLLHPGGWDQPSMAAWAKALTSADPSARWSGLGFRLARD
jgi:hypothetical protein